MGSADLLRRYYEQNTPLFLYLSGGLSTYSLHRPVWGPDVFSREDAFAYPYHLVAREARRIRSSASESLHLFDLGCGVGGGLVHLAETCEEPLSATGITLSSTQVEWARERADRQGVSDRCTFVRGDFHDLPPLDPVDVAYAIEAFVQASDAGQFFAEAARAIRPGGRLILVDDFLADDVAWAELDDQPREWIETFRDGWQATSLRSREAVVALARQHGFECRKDQDLTSHLRLGRLRDQLIAWCVIPLKPLLWRWPYFRGLIGGHALQQCLARRLIRYRCLVFEWGSSS